MQIGGAARLLRHLRRFPEIIDAYRRAEDSRGLALRYLGVPGQAFPYELILRDGVQFRFESREEIKVFWNIFIRSSYCVDRDDRLILDAGANIDARDYRGRTPFRIAEGSKQSFQFQAYSDTAAFIKSLGADTTLGVPGTVQERMRDIPAVKAP